MLIEEHVALARFADLARSAGALALDVEGDGLFRYRARLCTVQISTGADFAVVDTLALDLREALGELLSERGPEKILHDAAFDARLLRDVGVVLGRVYDTAVAARMLGEKSTGLAALVASRFGLVVSKDQQQADWGARPLGQDALGYLLDDVRHLHALADRLREEARALGVEEEIAEECDYVLMRAAQDRPPEPPPWTRIKKVMELGPAGRAAVRELALVREDAAKRLDVPPFKVIGNETLVAIARKRPRSPGELASIPGALSGRARAVTGDLLAALRRAASSEDAPEEELALMRPPPPVPAERAARRTRDRALSEWRKKTAAERGVDPQVVLPGHCLNDIADADPQDPDALGRTAGLGQFRVARYGDAILSALAAARGAAA